MTKQPTAFIGLFYLLSVSAVFAFKLELGGCIMLMLITALCAVVITVKAKRKKQAAVVSAVLAVISALGIGLAYYQGVYLPQSLAKLDGRQVTVTAEVISLDTNGENKYNYLLEAHGAKGLPKSFKMNVYLKAPAEFDAGDEITAEVYITSKNKITADRVYLNGYIRKVISANKNSAMTPKVYINNIRNKIAEQLVALMGDDAGGIASAMAFGNKAYIKPNISLSFKGAGISHILAFSGLHISVLICAVSLLLKKLRAGRKASAWLCIAAVVFAVIISGCSFSALRAGIMSGTAFYSQLKGSPRRSVSVLAATAFLICAVNPLSITDVGFQLSFLATAAIITTSNRAEKKSSDKNAKPKKNKLTGYIFKSVAVTGAVTLFTLPVTLSTFGSFSAAGFLANIIVLPVVPFVIVGSGLTALFSVCGLTQLAAVLSLPLKAVILLIARLAGLLCKTVLALPIDACIALAIAVAMLVCGGVYYACRHEKQKAVLSIIGAVVCAVGFGLFYAQKLSDKATVKITAPALNQTASAIVSGNNNSYIMLISKSSGAGRALSYAAASLGRQSVQTAVLTQTDFSSAGEIAESIGGTLYYNESSPHYNWLSAGKNADIKSLDEFNIKFSEKTMVATEEKSCIIYTVINKTRVAFVSGKVKAGEIPACDICVAGELPKGENLRAEYLVVSDKNIAKAKKQFTGVKFMTSDEDLIISIKADGSFVLEAGRVDIF